MKIANIIIAHKNPGQLLRLINQYNGDLFHNFVHIDARCDLKPFEKVLKHPAVTVLSKRKKLVWAGYGFVAVTLDALHLIKNSSQKFFYINLISGMDFPIKPTVEFYDFLKSSYEHDPREYFEILDLSVWPGAHRYEKFHLTDWTIRGRYLTERIINKFISKRAFFGGKFKPYGRAAWFTASDHFVNYALQYIENNPGYLKFLKTTWSPDEFIWNTLVMNSPFKDRISPYLRHIDWSEGKVNPKTFRVQDLNVLLQNENFIARKFDESVDKVILDEIEASISSRV
jgi:hypothetical protein